MRKESGETSRGNSSCKGSVMEGRVSLENREKANVADSGGAAEGWRVTRGPDQPAQGRVP